MVKGLYTAYTGMRAEQNRLDIISNNLANSATIGYKQENVTNQSFDEMLAIKIKDNSEAYIERRIGSMSLGVKTGEVYTDYGQGSLRDTGNTYDIAIEGKGFYPIKVTDKNGNDTIKYTRNGSFKRTQDGFIVDEDGNHLQAEGGDLVVPTDSNKVVFAEDGNVFADNNYIDKINLVDFENYDYLKKQGDTMYATVEGAVTMETDAMLRQGFTEQSNVNAVSEMVEMIAITRAYEANQKAIQTIDGMLDQAVNSVGKI